MHPEHLTFIYAFNEEPDCNKHLEELPNDTLILSFNIPGRPATKKTSQRVVRRGGFTRILPSLLYEKYENHCKAINKLMAILFKNMELLLMTCGFIGLIMVNI